MVQKNHWRAGRFLRLGARAIPGPPNHWAGYGWTCCVFQGSARGASAVSPFGNTLSPVWSVLVLTGVASVRLGRRVAVGPHGAGLQLRSELLIPPLAAIGVQAPDVAADIPVAWVPPAPAVLGLGVGVHAALGARKLATAGSIVVRA